MALAGSLLCDEPKHLEVYGVVTQGPADGGFYKFPVCLSNDPGLLGPDPVKPAGPYRGSALRSRARSAQARTPRCH